MSFGVAMSIRNSKRDDFFVLETFQRKEEYAAHKTYKYEHRLYLNLVKHETLVFREFL